MQADQRSRQARAPWLNGWQGGYLALLIGVLAVILGTAAVQRPDYLSVLWNHPLGLRMATIAALLFCLGTAGFILGCWWINRTASRLDGERKIAFHFLTVGFLSGYLLLFYVPAVIAVLIGPVAVKIQESLR